MYALSKAHESPTGSCAGKSSYLLSLAFLLGTLTAGSALAGPMVETSDVFGQGPGGPVVAWDGAKLMRFADHLTVAIRIPTPEPGSYNYPAGNDWNLDAVPGNPEAFSMWVFVFNDPESCVGGGPGVCTPMDARIGTPGAGAFNTGGHLVSGPVLQFNGNVTFNTTPFGGAPLTDPLTAEVHYAIAPHGMLHPEMLPNQISTPIGTPGHWWVALFPAK